MEMVGHEKSVFALYKDRPDRLVFFADAYRTQVQQLCLLIDKTPGLPLDFVEAAALIVQQPVDSFPHSSSSSPSQPPSRD
jgi:hypothetical protein